MVKAWR